jgi:uncharacterized membrane protein required for colicin V production
MNANFNLPVNWFDIVVVVMLVVGITRGRKHGMSQEFLAVTKWIALILVSAIAYEPLGIWLAATAQIGKLYAYLVAYIATALLISLVFVYVQRTLGARLTGSDTFGKGEYYLAMPAGALRFACVIVAALALLNARLYLTAEVKAAEKYQKDNYGSQFFPTLSSMQTEVFEKSLTGPQIKKYLSFLLIKPTPPTGPAPTGRSVNRREFTLP